MLSEQIDELGSADERQWFPVGELLRARPELGRDDQNQALSILANQRFA